MLYCRMKNLDHFHHPFGLELVCLSKGRFTRLKKEKKNTTYMMVVVKENIVK